MRKIRAWGGSRLGEDPGLGRIRAWRGSGLGEDPGLGRIRAWGGSGLGEDPGIRDGSGQSRLERGVDDGRASGTFPIWTM